MEPPGPKDQRDLLDEPFDPEEFNDGKRKPGPAPATEGPANPFAGNPPATPRPWPPPLAGPARPAGGEQFSHDAWPTHGGDAPGGPMSPPSPPGPAPAPGANITPWPPLTPVPAEADSDDDAFLDAPTMLKPVSIPVGPTSGESPRLDGHLPTAGPPPFDRSSSPNPESKGWRIPNLVPGESTSGEVPPLRPSPLPLDLPRSRSGGRAAGSTAGDKDSDERKKISSTASARRIRNSGFTDLFRSKTKRRRPSKSGSRKKARRSRTPRRLMSGRQIAAAILAGIALLVGATFTTLWVLSLHRRNQALAEVEQLLDSNNFVNHRKAGRLMQQLGTRYPSDGRLWLEAARVDAQLALEFGAARNESAGRYLRRARDGGISKAKASPVQATLLLHQGELEQADLVLAAAGQLSDRDAAELVYLRGLWCLRRGQYEEAHKRLKAVEELPWQGLKRRGFVARAKAFMAQGDLAGARTLLGPPAKEPGNDIAQLLLQAHLALMEGEGLDEGAQAAEAVVTTKRKQAAPGQVAWAELLLARYGLAKQDRDLANTKIAAALKTRPVGDPLFGALLAETYLKLEDLDEAHEEAQKALKLAPTLPQLVTVYAETLFLRGETGEAERLLGGIDGTPEANLLLGRMALSRGETGEAKRALTLVKVASPLGAQAQLWLARVHLREGKAAKAVQILEPVLETDHPPQEVIMVLSKAYLELNQLAQAQSMLGRLAEERPDAPMISLNLGELYVRSASYEKAIPYLQKVVDSNPENASALALLGQAHEGLGHAAQATKLYKRALRLDNPPGEAVLGLVQVALAWGDLDRAEELLKRAPEDSPAGPLAMSQGMLALHRYQPGPALEALRKAVAARPDDPAVHALHGDALMAQESGVNLKAARRAYKKALTLSANYPPALVGLAEAALLSAKLRQAKKMLARTTRAMEQAATPPRLRARVLTLRGRYSFEVDGDSQQAVTLLQKAVELDDKLAETHLTLGFAQEDLGEGRKACHHFRTYLSLVAKGPAQDRQAAQGGVNEHCRN